MNPLITAMEVDWRFFLLNGGVVYAAYEWGRYRKEKAIERRMVGLGLAEYYLDTKHRRRWRLLDRTEISRKET